MSKFSIIIPTLLYREDILKACLDVIVSDSLVGEVIIINNSTKDFAYSSSKVSVYKQEENLFVNKSWNLGVSLAKNDYICLLNDDTIPCKDFFSKFHSLGFIDKDDYGLFGIGYDTLPDFGDNEDDLSVPVSTGVISWSGIPHEDILGDWGICIMGRKENFYEIPEELKIIFGDNYLVYKNKQKGKENLMIYGLAIKHIHSGTVRNKEFEQIVIQDLDIWGEKKEKFLQE